MNRSPWLLVALMPLLAGCFDPASRGEGAAEGAPSPTTSARDEILGVLSRVAPPGFDPVAAVDAWEQYLLTYPKRDWPLPHNTGASEFLRSQLEAAGYETEIRTFPHLIPNTPVPAGVRVVRGVLAAEDPTHRFVLVAHYDTERTTLQGAYDDGAGTMAQLEICRLLAQVRAVLHHTMECIFFDAEEIGMVASRSYAQWYASTPGVGFSYDLAFGYDMTGINWPGHAWKLYAMVGTQHPDLEDLGEPLYDFLDVTLHDFLGQAVLPGAEEGIQILSVHDRNSDEQQFKRVGVPVVRFAGGRNAADYPMYHQPGDTIPYVYEFAGGRAKFEAGFEAVVVASYYTILAFDAFDPWRLPTA